MNSPKQKQKKENWADYFKAAFSSFLFYQLKLSRKYIYIIMGVFMILEKGKW